MITRLEVPANQAKYPKVEISGLRIRVHKCKANMSTTQFELREDETYDAEPVTIPTRFLGYLVMTGTGDVRLLVDIVSEVDPPFNFTGSGLTRLQYLFDLELLPEEATFSSGRIKCTPQEAPRDTPSA